MGKLIVIEGSCDGVGKSTQYRMLIDRLKEEKENMIITDEPGIYIPGIFGIRIEDTILVNKFSCERLTKSNKEIRIIHND